MVELKSNKAGRRLEFFEKQYDGEFGNYLCMNQIALTRLHHQQALDLLCLVMPKDATILDIGCACGDFSSQVANNFSGAKVIGIDFVAKGFRVARKRYPHLQFIQGALPYLPFANASVNIVLCMEMLYYLEEQSRFAAVLDMSRILSPGDFLLVGTTLGNPRYFTEQTLMDATVKYFEIVDYQFEYLKPYIGAIKILRLIGSFFPNNDFIQWGVMQARKSWILLRIGEVIGKIIGKRAISNGAFLFKKKIN